MITRWQETNLKEALKERRGVHLTGVRQCGKTTLAEFVAGSNMRHLSLDDANYLAAAKNDPINFVNRLDNKTLVIDEIQKAPELLNAIKFKVDHDNSQGQYLITGSSNLRFVKAVKDSLAGRFGRIRLRTFTLGEIIGGKGSFLSSAFARDFSQPCPLLDKREIIHYAFNGGYPETLNLRLRTKRAWFNEYLDDLLTKDIQEITEVRKVDSLKRIALWMMAYSSKFFDLIDLCAASQTSKETMGNYITGLKTLYIVDEVPAWVENDYAKICKRPKFFASDSGLLANLLGWDEDSIYYNADSCGKLIETWVYHELVSLAEMDLGYEIFQYRDTSKREIDFIIKNSSNDLLGIEVKSGTVNSDDFKHLKWFGSKFAKSKFTGIVLYAGNEILQFGDGYYAVPLSALAI